jgi:hypothetical protein
MQSYLRRTRPAQNVIYDGIELVLHCVRIGEVKRQGGAHVSLNGLGMSSVCWFCWLGWFGSSLALHGESMMKRSDRPQPSKLTAKASMPARASASIKL